MIVSFSLAPEVFDSYHPDNPQAHFGLLRLYEAWHLLGNLYLPVSKTERRAWFEAMHRLPTPMRKRWQIGLMHNRWTIADNPDLQCVTPAQATEAGVMPPRISRGGEGTQEICRYDFADRTVSLTRARGEAHQGIPAGETVQSTWERKLKRLLSCARHVVLVDRYALEGHMAPNRTPPSGLERLLRELDALPDRVTFTLYTQPRANYKRALERLAEQYTGGGLREWRVRLVADEVFSRYAHDRHLRVDRALVQLGKGIEVLAGIHVFAASDFDLKPFSPFARAREEELRRACREFRWAHRGPAQEFTRL